MNKITKSGVSGRNAETYIDFINEKIDLKYVDGRNPEYGYKHHNFVFIFLFIISFILLYIFGTIENKYKPYEPIMPLLWFLTCIGLWSVFSWISYFLHINIKWLRDNYAETNNVLWFTQKYKKYDMKKKYQKNFIIIENKLIIPDYNIIYFAFKYYEENKITNISTHLYKRNSDNYCLIMEFEKEITKGYIYIKQ